MTILRQLFTLPVNRKLELLLFVCLGRPFLLFPFCGKNLNLYLSLLGGLLPSIPSLPAETPILLSALEDTVNKVDRIKPGLVG